MNKKLYRLSQIIFVVCLLSYIAFIFFKANCYIDADDASELVLARLINNDGKLFTTNWFYSTELRILSYQLVFSPMFALTHSFFYTRLFSSIILMIILILSYYYLLKQFELEKYFFISSSLLLLPLSLEYFNFVYKGLHYILNIAITFITLAVIEKYLKNNKRIILVPIILLSLISNLNSFKQLFYTQTPLLGVAILFFIYDFLKKNKNDDSIKYIKVSSILFISGLVGYLINRIILSKIFDFANYEGISLQMINANKFAFIMHSILNSLGLDDTLGIKYYIFLLMAIICVILFFISIVYLLKQKDRKSNRLGLFSLVSIMLYLFVYNFTSITNFARYNLPIMLMFMPMILMMFDKLKKEKTIYLLMIMFISISFIRYISLFKYDKNYAEKDLVKYLLDNEYYNGYAGFWNGNNLIELSEGKLDIYTYEINERNTIAKSVLDLGAWLQEKRHFENPPSGKVFVLFDKSVEEKYAYFDFRSSEILYDTDRFLVFGFNSYDDLIKEIQNSK